MRIKTCSVCGRELVPGAATCGFCKQLQVVSHNRGNDNRFGTTKKLSEVKSEDTKRISVGPYDFVFGETLDDDGNVKCAGIAIGSLNLLGGEPGAGKSTMALQMASVIAKTCSKDEYVLYAATEEKDVSIAARARRLNLENLDNIRIEDFSMGDKVCSEYIESLQIKPKFLFIDSTDNLSSDLITEMTNIGRIAHANNITVVYIHHVNKQFAFTGRMDIQHLVDGTFALVSLGDKDDTRELASIKNRHGRAKVTIKMYMDDNGLQPVENFDSLKFGDLPSESDYLSRVEDEDDLFIDTDEEEISISSKQNAWKMLVEIHQKWITTKSDDWLNVIEQLLNFANYTWQE